MKYAACFIALTLFVQPTFAQTPTVKDGRALLNRGELEKAAGILRTMAAREKRVAHRHLRVSRAGFR